MTRLIKFSCLDICVIIEPRCEKRGLRGFRPGPTSIGLCKHRRYLFYPSNKSKDADQLRSYCAADLHLCFRNAKGWFSHNEAQFIINKKVLFLAELTQKSYIVSPENVTIK